MRSRELRCEHGGSGPGGGYYLYWKDFLGVCHYMDYYTSDGRLERTTRFYGEDMTHSEVWHFNADGTKELLSRDET